MHIKHMSIEKNHQDDGEDWDELLTEKIFLGHDLPKQPPQPTDKNPKNDSPLPLVHSDLDEYGLDPYEFRLYAHVVRRTGGKLHGECFAKLKKTAEICHMSVRKAQYALKTLCDAGLILKEQRRGRTDVYRLTPKATGSQKKNSSRFDRKPKSLKLRTQKKSKMQTS
jgi:hypothetical protein